MTKSVSPIRLQEDLMQAAESTSKRFHRSTAEQIEYWADLGRAVAPVLDPDVLLSVLSGLTTIKTEPVFSSPVDPGEVFQALENDRKDGSLSDILTNSPVRFQASIKHPGYLERIDQNGDITTGQFENGQFTRLIETIS